MNKFFILVFTLFSLTACGSTSTPVVKEENTPVSESIDSQKENIVTYTDSGFSPDALTINKGATVTFKNESSSAMRPASANHPTHTQYPTTGGCVGSTFDACKSIEPGDTWSFKFDIAGNWGFHDHLHPENTGEIDVR